MTDDNYTPPGLDDLTLDEAKTMLRRIHRFTTRACSCLIQYTPENVCDIGREIEQIIERCEP